MSVGEAVVVDVGPVAHGGHCVARHEGRVVFVRHALPGERVRAVVTEGDAQSPYWRADAVEILTPSPDRVASPCPWAGPDRCGGCDWAHASVEAQRGLKAAVVREQLRRLTGIERDVVVEEVDGASGGLGWRTRVQYAVDEAGRAGLHAHRSHRVVPIDWCRIAHPGVVAAGVPDRAWAPGSSVEVVVSAGSGERLVRGGSPTASASAAQVTEQVRLRVGGVVRERSFRVSGGGFWQVHPGAAAALVEAVLAGLAPRPGESALDLYAGVGLFAAFLAEALGPQGRVTAVEADPRAAGDARANVTASARAPASASASASASAPVRVERGRVDHVLRRSHLRRADLVVLDPPRSGAGKQVVDLLSRVRARRIAYVACDPAALARDLKWFGERGYGLVDLRALDLFPMTHHVECVAILGRL